MTTVAYKDGILVSDSRVTTGDIISGTFHKKIWPLADGSCAAIIGNVETAMRLVDWLVEKAEGKTEEPQPVVQKNEVDVVHLRVDGTIWQTTNGKWFQCFGAYQAWGSGMGPALGVMAAGLDVMAAVQAATQVDPFSGGELQYFALPEAKPRLRAMLQRMKRKTTSK